MTHAATPNDPTPDHHTRPPAPASRCCLFCNYPLADRPIGTICPECGNADERVCAACKAPLDGLFEHDQCRSCGMHAGQAINTTLLARLSPEELARAEDASWVSVIAVPIGVITGVSVVAEDVSVAAAFVVALAVLIPSCGSWLAAITPEGYFVPRQLAFLRSAVRSSACAALALVFLLFFFAVLVYQPGVKYSALALLPVYGAMCLASGLHASALYRSGFRSRRLVRLPKWFKESLRFVQIIFIACGAFIFGVIVLAAASSRSLKPFLVIVIPTLVIALPAYAWYHWLILAMKARKIRHQRREAGAVPTTQQPTHHDR